MGVLNLKRRTKHRQPQGPTPPPPLPARSRWGDPTMPPQHVKVSSPGGLWGVEDVGEETEGAEWWHKHMPDPATGHHGN